MPRIGNASLIEMAKRPFEPNQLNLSGKKFVKLI